MAKTVRKKKVAKKKPAKSVGSQIAVVEDKAKAEGGHGSKSQAIRDWIVSNPKGSGAECVGALGCSLPLFYNVKKKMGGGGEAKTKPEADERGNAKNTNGDGVELLTAAAELVKLAGGTAKAIKYLQVLEKFRNGLNQQGIPF